MMELPNLFSTVHLLINMKQTTSLFRKYLRLVVWTVMELTTGYKPNFIGALRKMISKAAKWWFTRSLRVNTGSAMMPWLWWAIRNSTSSQSCKWILKADESCVTRWLRQHECQLRESHLTWQKHRLRVISDGAGCQAARKETCINRTISQYTPIKFPTILLYCQG